MTRFTRTAFFFGGAVLLVSGCDRATDVTTPSVRASAVQSAALISAEPRFFFLRPIARRSEFTGEFDASLSPVVEICVWQANACALPLVSRLTNVKLRGADGDDADDDENEVESNAHYGVRWRTRGLHLDPSKKYRIRVLVAGTELGVADVDVVRNAREARSVDKSRFVPLVAGKNLKVRFRIEKGAVSVLGAAGGQIVAEGGRVQLDIPAGALSRDVGFTFRQTTGPAQPGGFVVPGGVIEFGPDGLRFSKPVRLTLRYDEAVLAPGVEAKLRLQHLVGGQWVPMPLSTVDIAANTVTGFISGFSTYGIVSWVGIEPYFQGFGTATVDGVLGAGEWNPSASVTFRVNLPTGDTTTGTLYIMNDRANLYFALEVPGVAFNWLTDLMIMFDDNNDGLKQFGEDDIRALTQLSPPGTTYFADAYLAMGGCASAPLLCLEDIVSGGTVDGAAAFTNLSSVAVMEMVHPLSSPDLFDFKLAIGDTVGFIAGLSLFDFLVVQSGFPNGAWGHIVISDTGAPPPPPIDLLPDSGSATAGMNVSCAVEITGDAYCWGGNVFGALGNQSRTGSLSPVKVFSTASYVSVSAGSAEPGVNNGHTCGVTRTGEAHCWGRNTFGQLGLGAATVPIDTATPVNTSLRFKSISAGRDYTCAVTVDFAGYCWGANGAGQHGDGTQGVNHLPTPVAGGHSWFTISAGDLHTCGITTFGDVYCWGANNFGQLGLGMQGPPHLTPQLVARTFRSVSAGADHSCGVNSVSQVYCWGLNTDGQLGDGTLTMRFSPVLVGPDFRTVDVGGGASLPGPISAGGFTCGVKFTGAVFCWGRNISGQLGDGLSPPAFPNWLPRPIIGGHMFRNVSAGQTHACGVTFFTGDTYCWGSNVYGELGFGGILSPPATPMLVTGGRVYH